MDIAIALASAAARRPHSALLGALDVGSMGGWGERREKSSDCNECIVSMGTDWFVRI